MTGSELAIMAACITAALVLGGVSAWLLMRRQVVKALQEAEAQKAAAEQARQQVEQESREAVRQARDELHRMRQELERENRERRAELQRTERRLLQREEQLDRKLQSVERKEKELDEKEKQIEQMRQGVEELRVQYRERLEAVSGLSSEQAKELLLKAVEDEMQREIALRVAEAEERAKEEAERRAQKIVTLAIERCAVNYTTKSTVTTVQLPSDEMKGRIIGREGRNIRCFETLTGVDLIVDDTPEAVVVSSFDPVRREVARVALEMLISDGRIHPARIEEVVEKARQDVEAYMLKEAEKAVSEAGINSVPPGLMKLLGRLAFRTSYGQNVLWHSVEVAILAGMMASELKGNSRFAKRAGLFHDIGKAVDHQMEGTHTDIGVDILRRYGEPEPVIHAIAAHHGDVAPESIEAVLLIAADAISASRPGARKDSYENYIRRLEALERVANSFPGVDKAYVIQAGREIRVIVKPDEIDDLMTVKLARDIAQGVEQECQYPGQIKVTVIREKRHIEYAR